MHCPECSSTDISKNGKQRGKQNYLCKTCRRQFIETLDPPCGYSDEFKRECLKMYVNGMGFRGIERVKGVHHTPSLLGSNKSVNCYPMRMTQTFLLRSVSWMSWRPLWVLKKQNLGVDSR
jgi:transposase-like protein